MISAAGILFIAGDQVLLLRRSGEGDYGGDWALPGGKIENGESAEQAAVRECTEEMGECPNTPRALFARRIKDGVDYTTFLQRVEKPFKPTLNDEHDSFMWADMGNYPNPVHPGVKIVLEKLTMNELGIAQAMQSGELSSPQFYMNIALFDIRITGVGTAYRESLDEYVYRDPKYYLTDQFLTRCNGLPVILEHPHSNTLTSQEFSDRCVGSVMLPYFKGDEVWGIAKIYDAAAAQIMDKKQLSTSPAVAFRNKTSNRSIVMSDGSKLLVEGNPSLLDHIAICEQGVWDKAGSPVGVVSTTAEDNTTSPIEANKQEKSVDDENMPSEELQGTAAADKARKDSEMAAKARADAEGEKLDKILAHCDALSKRMDSIEAASAGEVPSKKVDSAEEPAKELPAAEGAKELEKEGDKKLEPAKVDSEEEENKEKARMDAEELKKRLDAMDEKMKSMPEEMSDSEHAKFADAQGKADVVAQAFGDQAPRPLRGESLLSYRKRLAKKFVAHSEQWKGIDLTHLTAPVLDIAEPIIFADAMKAARSPVGLADGILREIVTRDRAGRQITEFVGKPAAWMDQFRAPTRRVTGIGVQRSN